MLLRKERDKTFESSNLVKDLLESQLFDMMSKKSFLNVSTFFSSEGLNPSFEA